MSRMHFWKRVLLLTGWALLVFAGLKSEPLFAAVIGQEHSVCGVWGCSAPLPALLAWHGSAAILLIPAGWLLASRPNGLFQKYAGTAALAVAAGAIGWLTYDTILWWLSTTDLARPFIGHRILFATIAFEVPVIPLLLTASTVWLIGFRSRANADGRFLTQQVEDFGNVGIPHVNASS